MVGCIGGPLFGNAPLFGPCREQYIHKRSGWFVGQSPPGVPCSTPAEARAQSLKLVTQYKLRGIREFLKDVLPRLGT